MSSTEAAAAAANSRGIANVKLQVFWPNSPAAWFRNAEAQFRILEVTDPIAQYYLVTASLNEQQSDMVQHILDADVTADSFEQLRRALVLSHTLTSFQKVDWLVNMEPLCRRKPSELMAAMERLRPPNDSHFFMYHFLQRLPREVRIQLTDEDPAEPQKIADKADKLKALHQPQVHDVAVVQMSAPEAAKADSEDTVAAVSAAAKAAKKKKWKKQWPKRNASPVDNWQSPLCYFHVHYGDQAHRCKDPCAWPGN
jgi:hypothetical protein